MEKKRLPYPFKTIATAIAFSPRLEFILCESKHLAGLFDAGLLLVHVGKKTQDKEAKLNQLIKKLSISKEKINVIWKQGEAADTLLAACKEHLVDLLVLGAIEKESLLKYYLGSIARTVSRRAKCSVLLLTEPSCEAKPFHKIVVNGTEHPKTKYTLETALYLAKANDSSELYVVREKKLYSLTTVVTEDSSETEAKKIKKSFIEDENVKLEEMVKNTAIDTSLKIKTKLLSGKAGYCTGNFARKIKADLLVVNSPDSRLGIIDRLFPHDLEYILEDLPTNLLIVHSRI